MNGKKVVPHILCARLFRWTSVCKAEELMHLSECECPFDWQQDKVCINPFHYERVISLKDWNNAMYTVICTQRSLEDQQFAKLAIDWLQNRMKDNPQEMFALKNTLNRKGREPTPCTTIVPNKDGRISVGKYSFIWK